MFAIQEMQDGEKYTYIFESRDKRDLIAFIRQFENKSANCKLSDVRHYLLHMSVACFQATPSRMMCQTVYVDADWDLGMAISFIEANTILE